MVLYFSVNADNRRLFSSCQLNRSKKSTGRRCNLKTCSLSIMDWYSSLDLRYMETYRPSAPHFSLVILIKVTSGIICYLFSFSNFISIIRSITINELLKTEKLSSTTKIRRYRQKIKKIPDPSWSSRNYMQITSNHYRNCRFLN